jgi:hypothetical protein
VEELKTLKYIGKHKVIEMLKYTEKRKIIEAEPIMVALLDEIAERLLSLEKLSAKPKGKIYPINITVSKLEIIDFINGYPREPLFSISIFNDGPDEVYPSVNTHQKRTPLKYGEPLSIEFHAPRIEKLYLDVDEGKKANIRGFGMY